MKYYVILKTGSADKGKIVFTSTSHQQAKKWKDAQGLMGYFMKIKGAKEILSEK